MLRQVELIEKVKSYDPYVHEEMLNRAYVYSMKAHGSQKRASGDPYFSHPLEVAGILAEYKFDSKTIITALLHDVVEDCDIPLSDIKKEFGEEVAKLVDGVTKLKLIKVMPKQKLSLQKHKYRSERWHVIKGRAKVLRDNEKFTLELGDTIDIKKSQTHSLENVEDEPLEIVEIQTGEYLGEDDIVRLDDIYGRVDLH